MMFVALRWSKLLIALLAIALCSSAHAMADQRRSPGGLPASMIDTAEIVRRFREVIPSCAVIHDGCNRIVLYENGYFSTQAGCSGNCLAVVCRALRPLGQGE